MLLEDYKVKRKFESEGEPKEESKEAPATEEAREKPEAKKRKFTIPPLQEYSKYEVESDYDVSNIYDHDGLMSDLRDSNRDIIYKWKEAKEKGKLDELKESDKLY